MSPSQSRTPRKLEELPESGRVVLARHGMELDKVEEVARREDADYLFSEYAPHGQVFVINLDAFLDLPNVL